MFTGKMSAEIKLTVPERILEMLRKCEEKSGVRMEDLIVMAIIRVLEEHGVKPS